MRNNGYLKVSEYREDELPALFERHARLARETAFREAPLADCRETVETLAAIAMRDPQTADETLDLLLAQTGHPYRPLRLDLAHAFLALGCTYPDLAGDCLTDLAVMRDEDQSFEVREKIVHAAGTLGACNADLAEQAFHLVHYFTADAHPAVRTMAVNRLALLGKAYWQWREPAMERLKAMRADINSDVSTAASNRRAELDRKTIDDYIAGNKDENPLPPPFLM